MQHRQRVCRRRFSYPNKQQGQTCISSHILATGKASAPRKRRISTRQRPSQQPSTTSKLKSRGKRRRNPKQLPTIRRPTVAGQFYEGDAEALRAQIKGCFLHPIGPQKLPQVNFHSQPTKHSRHDLSSRRLHVLWSSGGIRFLRVSARWQT